MVSHSRKCMSLVCVILQMPAGESSSDNPTVVSSFPYLKELVWISSSHETSQHGDLHGPCDTISANLDKSFSHIR